MPYIVARVAELMKSDPDAVRQAIPEIPENFEQIVKDDSVTVALEPRLPRREPPAQEGPG